MKITFLGTAAAEGYPGIWCQCPHCAYARANGGKNRRANSCVLIDDDVMIDLSSTCFAQADAFGKSLLGVRTLLVTHAHLDHLYPQHLVWRGMAPELAGLSAQALRAHSQGRFTPLTMLTVYGNAHALDAIAANPRIPPQTEAAHRMACVETRPGCRVQAESLTFTPITARHGHVPGYTQHYIIERGGKTLLYAVDGDQYTPDMEAVLRSHRYDCVIVEGTYGQLDRSIDGHMSMEKDLAFFRYFNEHSLWKDAPRMIITHMSPHWTPPHDVYAPLMRGHGLVVAFDGMEICL